MEMNANRKSFSIFSGMQFYFLIQLCNFLTSIKLNICVWGEMKIKGKIGETIDF
jgi:hypothetical protein